MKAATSAQSQTWLRYQLHELYIGLRRPSAASLIGIFIVTLALLACCVKFITAKAIGKLPAGYLMTSPEDEDALLSSKVLRINQHPSQNISFVVMGDSSLREAITSEADLSQQISSKTGFPVEVHLLVTGAMSLWDDVEVSDFIGGKLKGLILLEVSAPKLSVDSEGMLFRLQDPRFALWPSPSFDDEAKRLNLQPPHHVNNFFIDNCDFFLARPSIFLNVLRRRAQSTDIHHTHVRRWTKTDWNDNDDRFQKWAQLYLDNRYNNLAVYTRMVNRLRPGGNADPNVSVDLLQGVENPDGAPHEPYLRGSEREQYLNDMQNYATQMNMHYWNPAIAAKLTGEDFADYMHVESEDARRRYTAAMADAAAAELSHQHQTQQKANP